MSIFNNSNQGQINSQAASINSRICSLLELGGALTYNSYSGCGTGHKDEGE
jgi:hypothetical protein